MIAAYGTALESLGRCVLHPQVVDFHRAIADRARLVSSFTARIGPSRTAVPAREVAGRRRRGRAERSGQNPSGIVSSGCSCCARGHLSRGDKAVSGVIDAERSVATDCGPR